MPTPPVQITGSYQSTLQYETHFFDEVWPRRSAFDDFSARQVHRS